MSYVISTRFVLRGTGEFSHDSPTPPNEPNASDDRAAATLDAVKTSKKTTMVSLAPCMLLDVFSKTGSGPASCLTLDAARSTRMTSPTRLCSNAYLRCSLGPWTQKAFEAPCRSLLMDARQAERNLRAFRQYMYALLQILNSVFLVFSRIQAPRPSPGPHKLRESLPLTIFLRNRLKYALTGREVTSIVQQRLIKVDGKVRTDNTYPAGFMGQSYA